MKLVDILKEKAHFDFYRESALYYKTDSGFRFMVPLNEVGNGTCNRDDKAITYLKWIKPQFEEANAIKAGDKP